MARYASFIYLIGALATGIMLVYGAYESGGFHREHTIRDLITIAAFYLATSALWPTLIVIVPLRYFGALPQIWDVTIAKFALLVVLLLAMATCMWANSRILSRAREAGHSYWLINPMLAVAGLRGREPLIFILAFLIGLASIMSLIALG